jgi:RND family efflux transporter MFP subunit
MLKKLLILPIVGLGVLAVVLMVKGKKAPEVRGPEELATTVRVVEVPRLTMRPHAIGYGEARPRRVWQAVPQVGGRIVHLSEDVKEGAFVPEEAVLVRIDRADYDLEVQVGEARLVALRAQLKETETREKTVRTSLAIEKRSLELAQAELERIRSLVKEETLAPADLDREERNALTQSLRVQEIENALTLLEPQRAVLRAQITQEESNLSKARLAVERTVIRAPFDCRIGPVNVEQDQVVQPGQMLFSADGTDATEVTAWLPTQGMRQILSAGTAPIDLATGMDAFRERAGLTAEIRLSIGAHVVTWPAEVVRIRGIDSQTRAIGIDVAVENPFQKMVVGVRPPLIRGMYVEVEIRSKPRPDQVVVPRSALHGEGVVYLVDGESRLVRRPVTVGFVQDEFAIVSEGLEGGETLVVSDLVPAIDRMLLDPTPDPAALAALEAVAFVEADLR